MRHAAQRCGAERVRGIPSGGDWRFIIVFLSSPSARAQARHRPTAQGTPPSRETRCGVDCRACHSPLPDPTANARRNTDQVERVDHGAAPPYDPQDNRASSTSVQRRASGSGAPSAEFSVCACVQASVCDRFVRVCVRARLRRIHHKSHNTAALYRRKRVNESCPRRTPAAARHRSLSSVIRPAWHVIGRTGDKRLSLDTYRRRRLRTTAVGHDKVTSTTATPRT